jgi:uncharacterized protein YndB with AHSA1/START domain
MSKTKTIEFKFKRTIPALPNEVFDAWLDPKVPGNPWNMADKLILHPKVDGFFYWAIKKTAHYGRFTQVDRPSRIQHTWVSPNTLGEESTVVVTFENKGEGTLMTLVHADLPDTDGGKGHEAGWNYFLGVFSERFENAPGGKK